VASYLHLDICLHIHYFRLAAEKVAGHFVLVVVLAGQL